MDFLLQKVSQPCFWKDDLLGSVKNEIYTTYKNVESFGNLLDCNNNDYTWSVKFDLWSILGMIRLPVGLIFLWFGGTAWLLTCPNTFWNEFSKYSSPSSQQLPQLVADMEGETKDIVRTNFVGIVGDVRRDMEGHHYRLLVCCSCSCCWPASLTFTWI